MTTIHRETCAPKNGDTSSKAQTEIRDERSRVLRHGDWVTVEHSRGRQKFLYRPDLPKGEYFGNCPRCWEQDLVLRNDGVLFDNGPDVWIVCHKHRVKWFVGSGLFSAWCYMSSEDLLKHAYKLSTYQEVEEVTDFRHVAGYESLLGHTSGKGRAEIVRSNEIVSEVFPVKRRK